MKMNKMATIAAFFIFSLTVKFVFVFSMPNGGWGVKNRFNTSLHYHKATLAGLFMAKQ